MKKKNNYLLIHCLLLNKMPQKIMMKNQKMIKIVKNGRMMINMSQSKKKNQKKKKTTNIIKIRKFFKKEENME